MSQRRESVRKKIAKVDISVREQSGRRIDAKLKFITPMFGGGVRLSPDAPHRKEHDAITPVRGASLRGQLREWWRRTCAIGLGLEQMQARERVLWGWASTKERPARGLVSLSVQGKLVAEKVEVYRLNERGQSVPVDGFGSPMAYGAFPLQPAQNAQGSPPGTLTRWKGEFQVSLALQPLASSTAYRESAQAAWRDVPADKLEAKLWDEVERAWLAFVTFGGLGGRTRRGFGAVQVVGEGAVPMKTVAERLGWTARVSALKQPQVDAEAAQKVGIAKLQSFRQGVGKGRNPGVGARPGRSRWPEPDEIRRLSRQSDPEHRKPIHDPAIRKFPRAAFGMPIIFHFQSRTDPGDHSLQPAGKERMASPIILRPVVDPDRKVHGVALLLPVEREIGRILGDLQIKARSGDHPGLSGSLTPPEVNAIRPLQEHLPPGSAGIGLSGARAVFEPFLQFFKG